MSTQTVRAESGSTITNSNQFSIGELNCYVSRDRKINFEEIFDKVKDRIATYQKKPYHDIPKKYVGPVSRQKELMEMVQALRSGMSVHIYGEAGMGKSFLTNVAIHQVKMDSRFSDGIIWPCYEKLGEDCVLYDVIDALASPWKFVDVLAAEALASKDRKTALTRLKQSLVGKELLIVLDINLRRTDLKEISGIFPDSCTLVLVSRQKIKRRIEDMKEVSLDALDREIAADLFMQLAGHTDLNARSGWKRRETSISIGVCDWERCIPAGIIAEAYNAKGKNLQRFWSEYLGKRQKIENLDMGGRLFRSMRTLFVKEKESPPGHHALQVFWNGIPDTCRILLTSLGGFCAGASEDALQEVCRLGAEDFKTCLTDLVNIGMVQTSSPRYHLPPFVKRWIREQIIPNHSPEVEGRVAEYFFNFSLQHQDQTDPKNIEALELERVNIEASLDWYKNTQPKDFLVNYVVNLSQHWLLTHRWREYVHRLDDVLEFERQINDPKVKAWAHHQRGSIRLCQNDFSEAQKHLEMASQILRSEDKEDIDIRTGLTKTLHNSGVLYESQDNIEHAALCYGESLSLDCTNELPTALYLESFLNQGPNHRNWGIEGIDLFDRERALNLRLQDLKENSVQVRSYAVRGLQKYNNPRAMQGLVSALQDTDEGIICEAVTGLGKIGDKSVNPELSKLWASPNSDVRLSLVNAFGQLYDRWEDTSYLTLLANGLNDQNRMVSAKAAQILNKTPPRPEAIKAYVTALERQDEAGDLAEGFIRDLGSSALTSLKAAIHHPNPSVRSRSVNLIAEISPADIPLIAEEIVRQDPNPEIRQQTVARLMDLPQITNAEKELVLRIAALDDQDKVVRTTAIRYAPSLDERHSVKLLNSVLEKESDSSNRELAIGSLGQIGSHDAFVAIAGRGLNDRDSRVKTLATRVLQQNPEKAVVPLSNVMLSHKLPIQSRLEAMRLLGNTRNPMAEDALIKASQLRDKQLQPVAFEQLAKIDTPKSVNRIVTALSDRTTSQLANRSLNQIQSPDNITKTLNQRDLDFSTLQTVSERLASFGPAAIPSLERNLKAPIDYASQLNNIRALSNINDPHTVSILGSVLQDPHGNYDVRRETVKYLEPWAQRNEQALDILLTTCQDPNPNLSQDIEASIQRVTSKNISRLENRLTTPNSDKRIRLEAARQIGQQGGRNQILNLGEKFYSEPDRETKLAYVKAIGEIGYRASAHNNLIAKEAAVTLSKFSDGGIPVIKNEAEYQISRIGRKSVLGNE